MSYKDRTRQFKHQISYYNEEVRRGRTGSQDDNSVSIGSTVASGLATLRGSLVRSVTMGGQHFNVGSA